MGNINNTNNEFNNLYNENIKPKNTGKKFKKIFLKSCFSLIFSFIIGLFLGGGYTAIEEIGIARMTSDINSESIVVTTTNDHSTDDYTVTGIVKKVTPSIVTITATTQTNNFFNIPVESEGAGSGVIFHITDTNTYILTNNHVISGAIQVGVAIEDSEPVYASLVGTDPDSDLAVISVLNSDLKEIGISNISIATFGNSDNMQEGDSVIAIGNALGEGKTATLGIISTTSKDIYIDGNTLNVLQTTAAINPGNSGGALINSNGEVIGINTAKIADTDVSRIGYSISSNVAMEVAEKIMNNTTAPALDVYIRDMTNSGSEDFYIGALVVDVIEGGSADKSGIAAGDIITSIDETPIFNSEQLINVIKSHKVGDTIKVKVIRGNEVVTIKVKLKESVNKSTGF